MPSEEIVEEPRACPGELYEACDSCPYPYTTLDGYVSTLNQGDLILTLAVERHRNINLWKCWSSAHEQVVIFSDDDLKKSFTKVST